MSTFGNAFGLKAPSVFVVCSPFQALCAIAAIRQLKIDDYKMIAFFPKGNNRNKQLLNILELYHVDFESFTRLSGIVDKWYKLDALRHRKSAYRRLFIADFRNPTMFFVGCRFVSDEANIVYLDDGSATISFLQDHVANPITGVNKWFMQKVTNRRSFLLLKNVLTIYDDIPNPKYNIESLDLSIIINNRNNIGRAKEKNGIYIVGTNISNYCIPLQYPTEKFIKKLEELFVWLKDKYDGDEIIYIPHGRDESKYAQDICGKYGCEFRRANEIIELELLKSPNPPKVIYGFTSSALYNLKRLFPHTDVVNILYNGNISNINYQEYLLLSEYYQRNGIETMKQKIELV